MTVQEIADIPPAARSLMTLVSARRELTNRVKHAGVRGPSRDPHRIMINLGVDDIHRRCAALCAKGVVFLKPPTQEEWGGWIATFVDPDGNLLQLLQQPSG